MTEQRTRGMIVWLVPSLLGVITSLMVLGGTIFIGIMTRQADEIHGLRDDFQKSQVLMEARVTRLEDAMIRHVYTTMSDSEGVVHREPALPKPKYHMHSDKP